jgi:alpha-ribazole phosphatase
MTRIKEDGHKVSRTNWWWLRHAPTDAVGKMIGSTNINAQLPDHEVLKQVSHSLPADATWLVSPLDRCKQTAEALRGLPAFANPPQKIVPDLREQDFGDWDGRAYDEPEIRNAEAFWQDPGHTVPPHGESFFDMMQRVQAAIQQNLVEGNFVVVAHAGVIRAAVALALNLTPDQALRLQIDPLSLTRTSWTNLPVDRGGSWLLQSLNEAPVDLQNKQ